MNKQSVIGQPARITINCQLLLIIYSFNIIIVSSIERNAAEASLLLAEKLHQGLGARLFEDLVRLRTRLTAEQIAAYEAALRDIKQVSTVEQAQDVLRVLFDKFAGDAEKMPDAGNDDKDKVLQVAQDIAFLKRSESIQQIVNETTVRY